MRYEKGTIQLNQERDIPALRQVLRSGFITQAQLFEFMRLAGREDSEKHFSDRLRRLVAHQLVHKESGKRGRSHAIYSIAELGIEVLIDAGEMYAGRGSGRRDRNRNEGSIQHALGLNDIQLTLYQAGILVTWTSESEICSQNDLTGDGYAKDYDAIATVVCRNTTCQFALEYERTRKTYRAYFDIAAALAKRDDVHLLIYLVPNEHLKAKVSHCFRLSQKQICVGFVGDFLKNGVKSSVSVSGGSGLSHSLEDIIIFYGARQPQDSGGQPARVASPAAPRKSTAPQADARGGEIPETEAQTTSERIQQLVDQMPERLQRSKLDPYADVIRELRRKRRTYSEIARFFREHLQLTVNPSTIHYFVNTRACENPHHVAAQSQSSTSWSVE